MTILADWQIAEILDQVLPIAEQRDPALINPASLDLRIGSEVMVEEQDIDFRNIRDGKLSAKWVTYPTLYTPHPMISNPVDPEHGFMLDPGRFALVSVFEHIHIPNGFAMELRLKSSVARRGFNHSLAFWIDPGWDGVLTMEVQNLLRFTALELKRGAKFAQAVIHKLAHSERPYSGKYKGARKVEGERK